MSDSDSRTNMKTTVSWENEKCTVQLETSQAVVLPDQQVVHKKLILQNEFLTTEAMIRNIIAEQIKTQAPPNPQLKLLDFEKLLEKDFYDKLLKEINDVRKRHNVKPLKMDSTLSDKAKEIVDSLVHQDRFHEMKNVKEGCCFFSIKTPDPKYKLKVEDLKDWTECVYYDFTKEPEISIDGNFTQIIWKNTEAAGFNAQRSNSNTIYVVGLFNPKGNRPGSYLENVLPPTTTDLVKLPKLNIKYDEYLEKCLKEINKFRANHDSPPVKKNEEGMKEAQDWAETLMNLAFPIRNPNRKYGQNIYIGKADKKGRPPILPAIYVWYKQYRMYDFEDEETISLGTEHFVEIVWKATTSIALGIAKKQDTDKYAIVVNFYKGSDGVSYKRNVLPPKKKEN